MKKRSKAELVKAWLLKALKDLETAYDTLGKGEAYTDISCFHAQQAAEKTLKAYLVWHEIEFPKTHVLEDLLDLVIPKEPFLKDWKDTLKDITPYAVETRYPEFSQPSLREAKQAVKTVDELMSVIKSKLPKECLPLR